MIQRGSSHSGAEGSIGHRLSGRAITRGPCTEAQKGMQLDRASVETICIVRLGFWVGCTGAAPAESDRPTSYHDSEPPMLPTRAARVGRCVVNCRAAWLLYNSSRAAA